jgi:hypoxanthine phosphoribosyltransferase
MSNTISQETPDTVGPEISADSLKVLITEEQLQTRVREMAREINATYRDSKKLVIIAILKGSFIFLADLIRHLEVPCQVEFIRLASYGNNKKTSGTIRPVDLTLPNLADEDVLLVEDIIDTGLTLSFFMDYLQSLHKTKSLRLAVLLDKPEARNREIAPVPVDFTGFRVGNDFLVGYGLDYAGYYRNLPYIALVPCE